MLGHIRAGCDVLLKGMEQGRAEGAWLAGVGEMLPPARQGNGAMLEEGSGVRAALPLPIPSEEEPCLAGLDVPERLRRGHVQNHDVDGIQVDGEELVGGKALR